MNKWNLLIKICGENMRADLEKLRDYGVKITGEGKLDFSGYSEVPTFTLADEECQKYVTALKVGLYKKYGNALAEKIKRVAKLE